MKKFFKSIVILLNLIAVLALLIVYSSVYISPASFWAPAVIGLAYPYILFINVLFILYWLFGTSKMALVSTLFILLGYNHLHNYFQFKSRKTDEAGITICSYNIKQFQGLPKSKKDENVNNIIQYIKSKNPDIVCLQEMNFLNRQGFDGFRRKYSLDGMPKNIHLSRLGGPVTFTNFPIINKGEISFEKSGNMIIFSDIIIEKDTFRLFNCHLQSYRFTPRDISSLDSISFDKQDESLKEFRLFGSKLKQAFIKRTSQANQLREQIEQSPYPVIVCGDFNDTPVSYAYRRVRGNLKDAFVESGAGIGNTYLGRLPSFRIDYILHSDRFEGYNFTIDKIDYSDHYPVSCKLIWAQEKAEE